MKNVYGKYILPKLTHWVCSQNEITRQRRKVVPLATGKVLEIGIGSGLNLPFYNPENVDHVWGMDPMVELREEIRKQADNVPFDVKLIGLSGEEIPLDKNTADTVVLTYTLCSIPNACKALKEMHRVLKPGGKLIFLEHGQSPEKKIQTWQNRINPIWMKFSGGCHLNRSISDLIKKSGFTIKKLDTGYQSALKIISYNYWGVAVNQGIQH